MNLSTFFFKYNFLLTLSLIGLFRNLCSSSNFIRKTTSSENAKNLVYIECDSVKCVNVLLTGYYGTSISMKQASWAQYVNVNGFHCVINTIHLWKYGDRPIRCHCDIVELILILFLYFDWCLTPYS